MTAEKTRTGGAVKVAQRSGEGTEVGRAVYLSSEPVLGGEPLTPTLEEACAAFLAEAGSPESAC